MLKSARFRVSLNGCFQFESGLWFSQVWQGNRASSDVNVKYRTVESRSREVASVRWILAEQLIRSSLFPPREPLRVGD